MVRAIPPAVIERHSVNHIPRGSDRRAETRWPSSRAPFGIKIVGASWEEQPELVDFSAGGLGLRVPARSDLQVGTCLPLTLHENTVAFARLDLRVGHATQGQDALVIGGAIVDAAPIAHRSRRLPRSGDVAELRADGPLVQLLTGMKRLRPLLSLALPDGRALRGRVVEARPEEGAERPGVPVEIEGEEVPLTPARVAVTLVLHDAHFWLEATLEGPVAGAYSLVGPFAASCVARRQHDRISLEAVDASVWWTHPLDPQRRVSARLRDISALGLGVEHRGAQPLFPPGAHSPLHIDVDGARLEVDAELAHASRSSSGSLLGFRMYPCSDREAITLARLCQNTRFPRLLARADARPDAVEQLMRDSGYLGLRDGTSVPRGWHRTPRDESLWVDHAYVGGGELAGHISGIRIYENTWMYHQLATVGHSRHARDSRYALYRDVTNWVALAGACSMAYFDRTKRWHQHFFGAFIDWVANEELATIVALDRFEREGAAESSTRASTDVLLELLPEAAAEPAAAWVARWMPPLVRRAMELDAPAIARELGCAERYARHGLVRSRSPYAVRVRGALRGVVLCETGTRHLSLFNLLNMAQVYVDPELDVAEQVAILEHVKSFYRARGTPDPIVVAPPGVLRAGGAAGVKLAETMGCIVISDEGLRQYRAFLALNLGVYAEGKA
jgi:PilZ domain